MITQAPAPERPLYEEELYQPIPDAPVLLLAGAEEEEGNEPHICRGID